MALLALGVAHVRLRQPCAAARFCFGRSPSASKPRLISSRTASAALGMRACFLRQLSTASTSSLVTRVCSIFNAIESSPQMMRER
jgi:hypothetical protein